MKTRSELREAATEAMVSAVLRHVEDGIKASRPDTSAVSEELKPAFEAGFRACKRTLLDMLAD